MGFGKLKYPDGSTYEGYVRDRTRFGWGELVTTKGRDGTIYNGFFVNEGRGELLTSIITYNGGFKDGKITGYGKLFGLEEMYMKVKSWTISLMVTVCIGSMAGPTTKAILHEVPFTVLASTP